MADGNYDGSPGGDMARKDQMRSDPSKVVAMYDANGHIFCYTFFRIKGDWAAALGALQPEVQMFLEEWRSRNPPCPLHVIDAGCGDGLLADYIQLPRDAELHGFDLSRKMVARAGQRFRCSFKVADIGTDLLLMLGWICSTLQTFRLHLLQWRAWPL